MRLSLALFLLLAFVTSCWASEDSQGEEPLPLPDAAKQARELKLGEKLALEDLGPLIVAADGSLRRIANWQALSEGERQVALRRLAKRNKERLAGLQGQQQEQEQEL